jgi:hypothetical protein
MRPYAPLARHHEDHPPRCRLTIRIRAPYLGMRNRPRCLAHAGLPTAARLRALVGTAARSGRAGAERCGPGAGPAGRAGGGRRAARIAHRRGVVALLPAATHADVACARLTSASVPACRAGGAAHELQVAGRRPRGAGRREQRDDHHCNHTEHTSTSEHRRVLHPRYRSVTNLGNTAPCPAGSCCSVAGSRNAGAGFIG